MFQRFGPMSIHWRRYADCVTGNSMCPLTDSFSSSSFLSLTINTVKKPLMWLVSASHIHQVFPPWNTFLVKLLNDHSPVLLLLPFLICSYSPALHSPNSFSASKKQWVMTEPNILANGWPLPWHSAHTRDWKDLPDCEMGDSREIPGLHCVRAWL